MTELRPCPFCGGKAEVIAVDGEGYPCPEEDGDGYAVRCMYCGANILDITWLDAAERWNGRASV